MRLTGSIYSNNFINNHPSQTPDWIKDTDFSKITATKPLNIHFDNGTIADEKVKVNRDNRDYNAKPITAKLNDNEVMLSKIELSKFLGSKHYNIKQATKTDNHIYLYTNISNVPGSFNFIYDIQNNHIVQSKNFEYNDCIYPFNKAGLEECLNDIKQDNKKVAQKVETDKASIITSEEIYRRYNGHIRQATERINELLKDGSIIGVGSNKFGTYYDVDYLFPQVDKETIEKGPQFEFVKNLEKTTATPHKSAYQLAMEASSMFNVFDDYKIIDYKRNNNTLTIQAKVLKNNISKLQIFNFDIKDEKIKYKNLNASFEGTNYTQQHNTRINEQNIINKNHIQSILTQNGYINANVDGIFKKLTANQDITQIDNNNYISQYSTEEILNKCTNLIGEQDNETYYALNDKVQDLRLSKQNVKDTGVRTEFNKTINQLCLEASQQLQHNFDDYKILNYKRDGNKLLIKAKVLKNNIAKIGTFGFIIENNKVQPKKFKNIENNNGINAENNTRFNDKNIITKNYVNRQLKKQGFFNYNINSIFDKLVNDNIITQISKDKYVSKYTVNQLMKYASTLTGIQNKEKLYSLMTKKDLKFNKIQEKDHGVREIKAYVTNETIINAINKYLSSYFDNFNVIDFKIDTFEDYQAVEYNIEVFNTQTGLSLNITLTIIVKNNIVTNCSATINGEQFGLNDINEALNISDSLNNYLNTFKQKQVKNDIIFTKHELENKLQQVAHLSHIDDTLALLQNKGYITEIGTNQYASKYTIAELINKSNLKALSKEEINQQIKKSQLQKNMIHPNYITDNDTRKIENVQCLTLAGKVAQQRIKKCLAQAYNNEQITLKKFNTLTAMCDEAKSERELSQIENELKKYIL